MKSIHNKLINASREARKHPSITSITTASSLLEKRAALVQNHSCFTCFRDLVAQEELTLELILLDSTVELVRKKLVIK